MSTPRKHHYVPQFYLAGFTRTGSRDGQIHVIDKLRQKEWRSSPGNAACAKDFYLVDVEADGDPLAIEKLFARVEDAGAEAIRHIISHQEVPTGELYSKLIEFIAIMAVRGPAVMQVMEQPVQQIGRIQLIHATSSRERWEALVLQMTKRGNPLPQVSWEDMHDFARSGGYTIEASQNFKMSGLLALLQVLPSLLGARHWAIMKAPTRGPWFICGDRPVSLSWDHPQDMRDYSPGLGLYGTSAVFPASKELALIGRFEGRLPPHRNPARMVGITNMWTATQAKQYIYSTGSDFEVIYRDGSVWTKETLLRRLARADNKK